VKPPAHHSTYILAALGLLVCTILSSGMPQRAAAQPGAQIEHAYIVQAHDAAAATAAVTQAGGTVMQQLAIIGGVAARLNQAAHARLQRDHSIALHFDTPLQAAGGGETDTTGYLLYPSAATGVLPLHTQKVLTPKTECKEVIENGVKNWRVVVSSAQEQRDLQGWGVTVAVIDSGFMQMKSTSDWKNPLSSGTLISMNAGRCIIYRDFLDRNSDNGNLPDKDSKYNSTDQNGHGTHVESTIADNRKRVITPGGSATPLGVAPQVNLLVARALDKNGSGTYAQVIAAIDWIVANKSTYNVRVLNLSLYAPVTGPYWADPLNQAVMKAWQAGIVVVAAAGNNGPTAGTISVPGNVPYVITVGAVKSGRYNASAVDELAAYSSRGPTESAFVKPDVVVPASRTIAPMPDGSLLAGQVSAGRIQEKIQVDYQIGAPFKQHSYYQLSGTSMAAAEVSGIVALMLQKDPTLTNDQVKYRLLETARPATDLATGLPVYSSWEQGAGLVDARQSVLSSNKGSANPGMDITLDLTSNTHYWGYTTWDTGRSQFRLVNPITRQALEVWDGANRTWAGGNRTWAGANRTWAGADSLWAGANRTWAGANRTWAGADSLWAGANRTWAGMTTVASMSTTSHAELLVNE
jgi:serine protease AprX